MRAPFPEQTKDEGLQPWRSSLVFHRSSDQCCSVELLRYLDILFATIQCPPGLGALGKHGVKRLDILYAAVFEPVLQRLHTLPRIDGNSILPGCTAAQHA